MSSSPSPPPNPSTPILSNSPAAASPPFSDSQQTPTNASSPTISDREANGIHENDTPSIPRLPMEVLLRVVEYACATGAWYVDNGLDPKEGEKHRRMKFHLLAGVNVSSTASIDLDTFVSSFPSTLRHFTFLADATLQFASSFDRILESQSGLKHLHLRADFISLDFFLRLPPSRLTSLTFDLATVVRDESPIPWHLVLNFSSQSSINYSTIVAREFRRVGLGWTTGGQGVVRTQVLRRLGKLAEMGNLGGEGDEEGRELEEACGCESESESQGLTGSEDSEDEEEEVPIEDTSSAAWTGEEETEEEEEEE
ncbi:hypothetical protein P7C70_g7279, partial [Phenoliferia sp. Uapishka_3]